eukprot:6478489-Amphidinium_carterae.1
MAMRSDNITHCCNGAAIVLPFKRCWSLGVLLTRLPEQKQCGPIDTYSVLSTFTPSRGRVRLRCA